MGHVTVVNLTVGVIVEIATVVSPTKNSNTHLGNRSRRTQNNGWTNQSKRLKRNYIGAGNHVVLMSVVKM